MQNVRTLCRRLALSHVRPVAVDPEHSAQLRQHWCSVGIAAIGWGDQTKHVCSMFISPHQIRYRNVSSKKEPSVSSIVSRCLWRASLSVLLPGLRENHVPRLGSPGGTSTRASLQRRFRGSVTRRLQLAFTGRRPKGVGLTFKREGALRER